MKREENNHEVTYTSDNGDVTHWPRDNANTTNESTSYTVHNSGMVTDSYGKEK